MEQSVAFMQTEAADAFNGGLKDREVKKYLLMSGDRSLNNALN